MGTYIALLRGINVGGRNKLPMAEFRAVLAELGLTVLQSGRERYQLDDGVFYLHAPDGIGRSKLAARAERALGVATTARNWQSVEKIMALTEQVDSAGG